MGSVYKRGRTWCLKDKDAAGASKPEPTKAATKTEARALLHAVERASSVSGSGSSRCP